MMYCIHVFLLLSFNGIQKETQQMEKKNCTKTVKVTLHIT